MWITTGGLRPKNGMQVWKDYANTVVLYQPECTIKFKTLELEPYFWMFSNTKESQLYLISLSSVIKHAELPKSSFLSSSLIIHAFYVLPVLTYWSWRRWCRRWQELKSQMKWLWSSWRPWQAENSSKRRYATPFKHSHHLADSPRLHSQAPFMNV